MTTHPTTLRPIGRGGRSRDLTLLLTLVAALATANVLAQAPAAATVATQAPAAEELEGLVGRIALYPDDLVGIILPASTNPLQIVQADRYLEKRKQDPKAPIDEKWDDPVKALLNYPDVVKMMSQDLDWTAALGEAVAADTGEVMEAVQAFRRRTQSAGNLKTDDKQTVVVEKEVIKIVPSNPEVIYVPQYNPTTVVYAGYPYAYYPSPYPVYYYPYAPGAAFAAGIVWGAAMGAIWNGGHYGCGWGGGGNNTININRNTNINTGNINTGNVNRPSQGGGGGSSQWKSNKQPGQVSSSVGKTASSARAGDARAGGGGAGAGSMQSSTRAGGAGGGSAGAGAARPSAQPAAGGGARTSTQPAGGGAGGAGSASRASPSGGSAFSDYGSGRQTQMDSSRGASSRSSAPSGGARSAPSGGGARAGGGGGGGGRRR